MDKLNSSISEYVKSGKYYEDARVWYANRFIFPVSERTYTIVLVGLFAFGSAVLWFFFSITQPAPDTISYVSPSPDIAKSYSVIFPAGDGIETPQVSITKYILSNYVIKRESYSFDHGDDQLNFVRNTTVATNYLRYENDMSINNPDSPKMIYQDGSVKTIKVLQIKFLNSTADYQQAVVYFRSALKNIASNHVSEENLVANIRFQIDDISVLLDKAAKQLKFLVLEYYIKYYYAY